MVTTHATGTAERSVFFDSSAGLLSHEAWMGEAQQTHIMPEGYPVSYEGDKPVIDPALMDIDRPYPLMVFGELIWMVKGADESINFYSLLGHQ